MIVELRADNRSDLFSLGAVFYEMLAGDRLFKGDSTSAVLEQVVAGTVPSPRAENPEIPDAVLEILKRALEREPTKRFASAAEMGQACEHFLYDKGYGPTNLALKQYLGELFPAEAAAPADVGAEAFPALEPTLIPIGDSQTRPPDDTTPVSVPRPPGLGGDRGRRIVRKRT
jgi:serine/threonine-protein kinase